MASVGCHLARLPCSAKSLAGVVSKWTWQGVHAQTQKELLSKVASRGHPVIPLTAFVRSDGPWRPCVSYVDPV